MKKYTKRLLHGGSEVYIRPLCKKDISDRYLSWLRDKEVTRFLEIRFNPPTTMKELVEFYKKTKNCREDKMFAILTRKENVHIGNVKLAGINYNHGYANMGIMIGEKRCWGRGYCREASEQLLSYAFNKLKLNKVIVGAYSNHKSAIRAYKNMGFKQECRIKDFFNFEGRYVDEVIMGISRREFLKRERP